MSLTPTHYTTLHLPQNASPTLIRKAYKSLALTCHPDKTIHLPATIRATHAALFRRIQEAYDVLGSPAQKAAYDRELARHGGVVDMERSTFHRAGTPSGRSSRETTSARVRLTSEEEKRAARKRAEEEIAYLRAAQAKRAKREKDAGIPELKLLEKVWREMGSEAEARTDGEEAAYCMLRAEGYSGEIMRREHELSDHHDETPKGEKPPFGMNTTPQTPPASASASGSVPIKGSREAQRHTDINAKAAAVRAEKEKLQKKRDEQARKEAERIARVRAKAGPPVKAHGEAREGKKNAAPTADARNTGRAAFKKKCTNCGGEHNSFLEWRRCTKENGSTAGKEDDESFFQTV